MGANGAAGGEYVDCRIETLAKSLAEFSKLIQT